MYFLVMRVDWCLQLCKEGTFLGDKFTGWTVFVLTGPENILINLVGWWSGNSFRSKV